MGRSASPRVEGQDRSMRTSALYAMDPEPGMLDGRSVPPVAVGRFGAVVCRRRPGSEGSIGRVGDRWEVDVDGEWMPLELPIGKAPAVATATCPPRGPAHRRDFTFDVYAAVVTAPHEVGRAPWAAVLEPDRILRYLAGLPSAATQA
jgi:hypothetical protein